MTGTPPLPPSPCVPQHSSTLHPKQNTEQCGMATGRNSTKPSMTWTWGSTTSFWGACVPQHLLGGAMGRGAQLHSPLHPQSAHNLGVTCSHSGDPRWMLGCPSPKGCLHFPRHCGGDTPGRQPGGSGDSRGAALSLTGFWRLRGPRVPPRPPRGAAPPGGPRLFVRSPAPSGDASGPAGGWGSRRPRGWVSRVEGLREGIPERRGAPRRDQHPSKPGRAPPRREETEAGAGSQHPTRTLPTDAGGGSALRMEGGRGERAPPPP